MKLRKIYLTPETELFSLLAFQHPICSSKQLDVHENKPETEDGDGDGIDIFEDAAVFRPGIWDED